MNVAVPKEVTGGETRVAAIPETVKALIKLGLDVAVEAGAGEKAFLSDSAYGEVGARIVSDPAELLGQADLVLKVHPPTTDDSAGRNELALIKRGAILVSLLYPATHAELVAKLAAAGVASFALDKIPRISRAQSMDVLSSMSTIAGYKAVLQAADTLGRMCPMLMTAAGTLRPVQALVIGAGVAGLQAIATAKRLGAVVTAVDVRPAVKEQIESLGAKFVPMEVQHAAEDAGGYATDLGEAFYKGEQDILAPHVKASGMVVTTALIPGKPAPKLITREMVESMAGGSVIVDLAAIAGGNCTLSQPDRPVVHAGVTILAPTNLPASMPVHASQMFARNVLTFVKEFITEDGQASLDLTNEVIRGTLITRDGQTVPEGGWPAPAPEPEPAPEPAPAPKPAPQPPARTPAAEGSGIELERPQDAPAPHTPHAAETPGTRE